MRKSSLLLVALAFVMIASAALLLRKSYAGKTDQDPLKREENELRALAIVEGRKRDRLKVLPEVVHETPSLQITNMEIVSGETSNLLRITFRNYSEKAINSLTVCSDVEENGWSGVTFHPPPGQALIEPHSEYSEKMPAGTIKPGRPLTVCALMFMDETDEGLPRVRERVKESYEKMKQEARKEKP